jgi:hypothetical protein
MLPGRDPGAAEFQRLAGHREMTREAAPAHSGPRFQDGDAKTALAQDRGGGGAGQTRPDDNDIDVHEEPRAINLQPKRAAVAWRSLN